MVKTVPRAKNHKVGVDYKKTCLNSSLERIPLYDFVLGHSCYCSKRTTNFHKVEAGHQTFAGSVAKHSQNSKLKPRGRDGDSTDGLISATPLCNGPSWVHLPTSGLQGATQIARDMGVALLWK